MVGEILLASGFWLIICFFKALNLFKLRILRCSARFSHSDLSICSACLVKGKYTMLRIALDLQRKNASQVCGEKLIRAA
jgi:hypothetical protein